MSLVYKLKFFSEFLMRYGIVNYHSQFLIFKSDFSLILRIEYFDYYVILVVQIIY